MNRPNPDKSLTVIGLATLTTILSTIAAIGVTLMLQPLYETSQTLGTASAMPRLIFGLKPLLWLCPWLSPLTGWLHYQHKLSTRLAMTTLFMIVGFSISYTIISIVSVYQSIFKVLDTLG
jgi:hypothetical protein